MKNFYVQFRTAFLFVMLSFFSQKILSQTTRTSIEQYGITWTFSEAVQCGQYITGDWWVIGPVTITSVSPGPRKALSTEYVDVNSNIFGDTGLKEDSTRRNGSMVVMLPGAAQGYDSRGVGYDSTTSITFPYTLALNRSLISSISNDTLPSQQLCHEIMWTGEKNGPQAMKTAAVLTCVSSAPPEDAFRPTYAGGTKTIFRLSDVNWNKLQNLTPPASMPSWSQYERYFERPWIDHLAGDWTGQYLFPSQNQAAYYREMVRMFSTATLMLNTNASQSQKEKLLIGVLQRGIDLSGITKLGNWTIDGSTAGRKWAILFARLMFDDSYFDLPSNTFLLEDMQSYYGKGWAGQTALWQIVRHHGQRAPYMEITPNLWPTYDGGWAQISEEYRDCCTIQTWVGQSLSTLLMGGKSLWNHNAYFDNVEDWMRKSDIYRLNRKGFPRNGSETGVFTGYDDFTKDMWLTHHSSIPVQADGDSDRYWNPYYQEWIANNQHPSQPKQLTATNITHNSIAIKWNASKDNVGVVGYDVYKNDSIFTSVTTDTTAIITGLNPYTQYDIVVRAKDGSSNISVPSFTLSVTTTIDSTDVVAPSSPTGVTASKISRTGFKLKWTPSTDNIKVMGYNIYSSGTLLTSVVADSAILTNLSPTSTYTITVKAKDGGGNLSSASTALDVTTEVSCSDPDPWSNTSFATQTGTFTAHFDVTPSNSGMDGVVGLTNGNASTFQALATTIQFATDDSIRARKAGVYTSSAGIAYTRQVTYHVRMVVSLKSRTYSVFITPSGGSEVALGIGYPFRSDQSAITQLNNIAKTTVSCNLTVANFYLDSSDTQAPTTPTNVVSSLKSATGVTLSWTASTDNKAVYEYDVYKDGVYLMSVLPGDSAKISGLTAATTYAMTIIAKDGNGNSSAASTALNVVTETACSTPDPTWYNTAVTTGGGIFSVSFDAVPSASGMDAVAGLSQDSASGYAALATTIQFNPDHTIKARNGAIYTAATKVYYTKDVSYRFRMVVSMITHTYNVYVTPSGGSEITLGTGYSFRIEQSAVRQLGYFAKTSISCNLAVSNLSVGSTDSVAPAAPASLTATNVSGTGFTLNWAGVTDTSGIIQYDVYKDEVYLASVTSTSLVVTGLNKSTAYAMTVKAIDGAGNVSASSTKLAAVTSSIASTVNILTTQLPAANNSDVPYELGTKFSSTQAGRIIKIRYYKVYGETGTHVGRIWSSGGTQLASATFENETLSGWQEAALSTPYTIAANTDYVVSVNSNTHYGSTTNGFVSAITNGPISGSSGANGVFTTTPGNFPYEAFQSSNYFRDVVFNYSGDTTAPTTPLNLQLSDSTATSVTLTWSASTDNIGVESYDVFKDGSFFSSVNSTSVEIAGLTPATSYTMTVKARDGAGNLSSVSTGISISTASGYYTLITSDTPRSSSNDGSYELGVRFQSVKSGFITKIRYYKHASETGTHTGRLWSSTGILLASAQFVGETSSGWQEATLSSPVKIQANTAYTVSVNSNVYYAYTYGGFMKPLTNGPLTSLTTGTNIENGVYNATPGSFPQLSSSVTNYFRDVVFYDAGDVISPNIPSGLSATNITQTGFVLSWTPSTDNVAVTGYDVFKNNVFVATVDTTSITLTNIKAGTTYTMTVKARDAIGNLSLASDPLNVSTISSFYSVLTTQTPAASDTDGPYEMGMKFKTSRDGQIVKIRYFKVSGETGTHTGRLWSAAGTQLTSVVFTGESSSGWQEAVLATPYNVKADSVYVVSVNAVSAYGATNGGFGSVITNGPISSIAGSNGVFGSVSSFPTNSYYNTNYFRDVVFNNTGDIQAPTAPSNLAATNITDTSFRLSWSPSTDNFSVEAYDVYKNGVLLISVTDTTVLITGLTPLSANAMTVKARDEAGNVSDVSSTLNVGTTCLSYSIFTSQTPANTYNDPAYELGVKFKSSSAAKVVKIRYYKVAGETGTHTGHLWSASGTELASAVFVDETSSGWQEAALPTPYLLAADSTYVVSVNAQTAYGATSGGLSSVVSNGPLSTIDVSNGVYGSMGSFPATSGAGANYFRDLVTVCAAADTIVPTAPSGLASQNITHSSFTLTWTASTDNFAVTAYDVYKNGVFEISVPGTSANISGLTPSTTYAMTVKAKDGAGNVSASSSSLNVSTIECASYSVLTSQTPTNTYTDGPYEMGMKFTSSVATDIIKLRFYKVTGETGTHIGRIWSAGGTLLDTVIFTGETSSGWQEATLATPYHISASTEYVVSVNSNTAYGATSGGLSSAITNGILSSVSGSNGVFGSTGVFPTSSFGGGNYFRDVVVGCSEEGDDLVLSSENPDLLSQRFGEKIKIYPNPTRNGRFNIEMGGETNDPVAVEITDIKGTLIFKKILPAKLRLVTINNVPFKKGVYIVKIRNKSFLETRKLVVVE